MEMMMLTLTKLLLFAISLPATAEVPPLVDGQAVCRQKWTFSGQLNKRMFESCLEEQKEAWTKLEALRTEHSEHAWFGRFIAEGCRERWTSGGLVQPEMVAYCYHQETEAFADLKLHSEQASFNPGGAEACFRVWRTKTGNVFGKTLECYRRRSEAPNFTLPRELQSLLGGNPAPTVQK